MALLTIHRQGYLGELCFPPYNKRLLIASDAVSAGDLPKTTVQPRYKFLWENEIWTMSLTYQGVFALHDMAMAV